MGLKGITLQEAEWQEEEVVTSVGECVSMSVCLSVCLCKEFLS